MKQWIGISSFLFLIGASIPRLAAQTSQANTESRHPSISANGRYVAFVSTATNLVAGDTNNKEDVFRWDRFSGTITRVSVP
jgi:Tol biopolymer transport system component